MRFNLSTKKRILLPALLVSHVALTAQTFPPVFSDSVRSNIPFRQDSSRAVTFADVDGDGDLDILAAKGAYSANQNRLFMNDGHGVFSDRTEANLPKNMDKTSMIAACDVDGDGDLDLVVGNEGSPDFLYLNDGKGKFKDATAGNLPVLAGDTMSLACGDLDGDGRPDIVVGKYKFRYSEQNRVLLNTGKGRFKDVTASALPPLKDQTKAVLLGDVDRDGDLDLLVGNSKSNSYSGQNRLYLNDGKGVFKDVTATHLPAASDNTLAMVLADVDSDGDLDLIEADGSGKDRLLLNDGKGAFTDGTAGRLPSYPYLGTTFALSTGDVDGDGDLDLFLGKVKFRGSMNLLLLNDGKGRFTDATRVLLPEGGGKTFGAAFADVDGDRDLDLITANSYIDYLFLNDGKGKFTRMFACNLPPRSRDVHALCLGDLDGDGDLDIVSGDFTVRDTVYFNDGNGRFTEAPPSAMPGGATRPYAMVMGDFDGDGDPDLVMGKYSQNTLYVNDGRGNFTDVTSTHFPRASGDYTRSLAVGDVDGDGDPDLVIGNGSKVSGAQNKLYLNDGKGKFTDKTSTNFPRVIDGSYALVLFDADGDKDLDLFVGNDSGLGEQNRLYLNNGKGVFLDSTFNLPQVKDRTYSAAAGDVDGDGDMDLVVGNRLSSSQGNQCRLYLNDGKGLFKDATGTMFPSTRSRTDALALVDLDGDGDLDLLASYFIAGNRIFLNDGKGAFSPLKSADPFQDAEPARNFALGDLDGDGDIDVACAGTGRSLLFFNSFRQVRIPHLSCLGGSFDFLCFSRPPSSPKRMTVWPFLSPVPLKTPLSIPPFGFLRIHPAYLVGLPPSLTDPYTGSTRYSLSIPRDPALAGARIFIQALAENPAGSSGTWGLANMVEDTLLGL